MDYYAIRAYCSQKSESIKEYSDFIVVIESQPIDRMDKRGDENYNMTYPPKELLMLN